MYAECVICWVWAVPAWELHAAEGGVSYGGYGGW